MGNIGQQIGQAFVQAIPTVFFVVLLVFILRRIFFQPLAAVIEERDARSKGAVARAKERAAQAEARTTEYEALWLKARQEIYSLREAERKEAVAGRDEVIRKARARAEAAVKAAQADIAAEADRAKQELGQSSAALANQIASVILAGQAPAGRGEETR
jgi:F-type H+-transporting ATPase subunit b